MSGFLRTGQVRALRRIHVIDAVSAFAREQEIALIMRERDPFHCDDPCPENPVGHYAIWSAGDIVCAHCSKVMHR